MKPTSRWHMVSLALPFVLGGCVSSTPEAARNPLGIQVPKLSPDVPEPAPFVREARPAAAPDFIPISPPNVVRPVATRDADALKKLESELDAQRKSSRDFATRRRPGSPYDGSRPPRVERPPPELMPPE